MYGFWGKTNGDSSFGLTVSVEVCDAWDEVFGVEWVMSEELCLLVVALEMLFCLVFR